MRCFATFCTLFFVAAMLRGTTLKNSRHILIFDVETETVCLRRRSVVGWLYEASIVGKVRVCF
jgi:hypothetical protein